MAALNRVADKARPHAVANPPSEAGVVNKGETFFLSGRKAGGPESAFSSSPMSIFREHQLARSRFT